MGGIRCIECKIKVLTEGFEVFETKSFRFFEEN